MSLHHLRLDNRRWQAARRTCLERDGWRCRECGRYGNEIDHVTPLHRGGLPYALSNLQCLCTECHVEKTRQENETWCDPERMKWRAFVAELAAPGVKVF